MKRRLRAYVIALTALFMASCAAFFSVTGVGKLASGAGVAVILLVAALEVGKLVMASFVHKRWKQIGIIQRAFAVFGIIVAMALTSIGIFGQLIGGYTATSAEFQIGTQEIKLKEGEKTSLQSKITRYEDQIDRKEGRADGLFDLRKQQEDRIDSLQSREAWRSAREAKNLLQQTESEIAILNIDIDSLNNEIGFVMEDIAVVDSSIVVMNGNLAQGEAAPLKMIADMLAVEMDTATKGFFGFFVLIFDPFAIMLVIFFNIEIAAVRREEEEEEAKNKPEPTPELISGPESTSEHKKVIYKETETGEFVPKTEVPALVKDESLNTIEDYLGQRKNKEQEIELVDNIDTSNLDKTSQLYIKLLEVLYIKGQVIPGGNLYTFNDFVVAVEAEKISISTEGLKDFLKVCVMLKIVNVDKHTRKAIMDYRDARDVISKLKD